MNWQPLHLNTEDIERMAEVHWKNNTTLTRYFVSESSEMLRRALKEEKAAVYLSAFAEVKLVYPHLR